MSAIQDMASSHRSVLLEHAVQALAVRSDGFYVDATFGRGGHSARILAALGPAGRLLAIDRDPTAVSVGATWQDERFEIAHARFSQLPELLAARRIDTVDGVLLDLGVSSPQLDDPRRGFSFREDGPLDMRMDPTQGISARQWLLEASEQDISEALKDYGQERFAVQVAKAIVAGREQAGDQALRSTGELAALVAGVVARRQKKPEPGKDPATRTFQALRILVNQELEELAHVLELALEALAPGGRLVVISFHSLEDRMVKQFFARESGRTEPVAGHTRRLRSAAPRGMPLPAELPPPRLRVIGRTLPDAAEIAANSRARSAVLRVAERV